MNLQTVKRMGPPRPGRKRLGRGKGSDWGKTSTRGQKGQGAHSSGGRHKIGFEGGQMPLFRRLPKRGFTNFRFRKSYTIINVEQLNHFADGAQVDFELIRKEGLLSPESEMLKVLGDGELKKKLNVIAHRFSASAKQKIEAAGGTVKELETRPVRVEHKFEQRPSAPKPKHVKQTDKKPTKQQ